MTDSRRFDYEVVNSKEAAIDLLNVTHFDVIVADCTFGGVQLSKTLNKAMEIPSIMVSNGGANEVHEILKQQPNCDLIIRDKQGTFVYDLLDLIEISIDVPSTFMQAIEALPIHSN